MPARFLTRFVLVPFVIGVSFLVGVAAAQQYMVGDRFLVDEQNPFVLDRSTGTWLYPWTYKPNTDCANTGLLGTLAAPLIEH